jgi:hypothetical protein
MEVLRELAGIAGKERVGIGIYFYPDGENLIMSVKDGTSRIDCAYPIALTLEKCGEGVLAEQAADCVGKLREKAEKLKNEK